MRDYSVFSDEELIEQLHHSGEAEITDYLLEKYKPLVRKCSNGFYLIGGDSNDLLQEGMIGLFKAIRDYKDDKGASFFTFAGMCIQRQLYTAVEKSKCKKNAPLDSYISLSEDGGMEGSAMWEVANRIVAESPEDYVLKQEFWIEFFRAIEVRLSKMERQVFSMYIDGMTYTEIAVEMKKEPKAIDNALQRIRKKVSQWNFQELGITASGA